MDTEKEPATQSFSTLDLLERNRILNSLSAHAVLTCINLEGYVEPWATAYILPTIAGDADAAENLSYALSNEKRGVVAVSLWKAKIPKKAFRAYLESVWLHDHTVVVHAAKSMRSVKAMFRYAHFDITAPFPEIVRVWRGTCGLTFKQSVRGTSWTTNRDIACWFAMRFANKYKNPLVISADVNRHSIASYFKGRGENEVILFQAPAAEIDGTQLEWDARHQIVATRYAKAKS